MILQFSVSNFRCFRKLHTLNFAASGQDKTLPDNCITTDLPSLEGKRWIKGVGIYGANASGKTTILAALEALAEMVTTSAKMTDPKEPIGQIQPFALCPSESTPPTAFGVVFVAESVRYEYRVAATRERIWHESLRAFPNKVEQLWFSRDWNPDTGNYAWSPERPSGFDRDRQLEGYTLSNMLFLSKAVASNQTKLEPVFRFFKDRLVFLDLGARSQMGAGFTLKQVEENTPLLSRIVELLRHADLGVTGVKAVEHRPPAKDLEELAASLPPEVQEQLRKERWMQPELTHRGSKAVEVALPWSLESAGTNRYFSLAGPWLDILSNGYTVCIDELETSLHPLMVRELLRLFFCPKENPKGAQILFTTHNPLLLDATLLRRDQVWFTDKDVEGESHLYPLTDYSPRKGESLVRGYLSGRYGAVPFVPTGLLGSFPAVETLDKTESQKESHD
ncbi:MAG TPA: ATP-binding protein [Candidatus Sulfotelmatobacter sp.]|jgi:hypothetical protein|nr:ATP-binding protein [Candidatus Sulfotelmatobacter sp.]